MERDVDKAELDVAIVGAGFAGLYMLHRCHELGLSARVFEAGHDLGGTWFWNRYPGARCDIPSVEYSYQFSEELQQEWEWSEKYATQGEILKYANHVAERFSLRPDLEFNTRVLRTHYNETDARWEVGLARNATSENAAETDVVSARFVVMATGCLSVPNYPSIEGLDGFNGPVYHTGRWPHEGVDFTGKRVGVIGTGSSAIQSIPLIAEQAASITVFQRTPNYSVPAHNAPLDPEYVADLKARYQDYREENWQRGFGADFRDNEQSAWDVSEEERQAEYERRWAHGGLGFLAAYSDLVFDDQANATVRQFIREKIGELVEDPTLADKLLPSTPVGCKRLCMDTNYYQVYNQDHVRLVDLRETPITHIADNSVHTDTEGYPVDCIILATGFDAMTGAVTKVDVQARGQSLAELWSRGPKAYLGLMSAGFPNLFLVCGPGSPSVLSNMLPSIEHHVEWISDCIEHIHAQGGLIEADVAAQENWVAHVNEVADQTVYPSCNSWYLGANVDGKERVFMPYLGVPPYVEKCREVVANDYEGFVQRA